MEDRSSLLGSIFEVNKEPSVKKCFCVTKTQRKNGLSHSSTRMLIIAAVGLDFINKIITVRFVIKSAQTSLLLKSMKKY